MYFASVVERATTDYLLLIQLTVGNMMQSVVLDGNPLNEDEDMRLLVCVVLDGNDEVILDLMDLVNDVNLM